MNPVSAGFFCCLKKILCASITYMMTNRMCFYLVSFLAANVFVVRGSADEVIDGFRDSIELFGPTVIQNNGIINEIYTNGYLLRITNYNTVNVIYNSGAGAVAQQIPNNDALHKLNVNGGNFSVDLSGLNLVDLGLLQNVVSGADKQIVINNSSVIINDFADWRNWNQNVLLSGTNTLYLKNPETVTSGELLKFVHDNETRVVLLDSAKLYKVSITHESGASFIHITKETDMSKLFDDERSAILQELQSSGANGALLNALNNAKNMQEVENILQSSYRFNPSILMRPVNTLNKFSLIDLLNNENSLYGGLSGVYVGSDTTQAFGLVVKASGKYEDFYMGTSLSVNRFRYKNDMNDFDGFSYGADIKVKKYFDDLWVHGIVGITMANFKTETIYYNHNITQNPFGYSGYGAIDVGYDYSIMPDLMFSPFVGGVAQLSGVAKDTDKDISLRIGSDIKYTFETEDIKYEYKAGFGVTGIGDLFGKIRFGFMSNQDGAGVSFDLDALRNDEDFFYKITLNGRISF